MPESRTQPPKTDADAEVMLGLLSAVEASEQVTQRTLAGELGIALGLVNTYLKRCVRKGLIKVQAVPRRRYAYYLTPQGFAEKSRLTADYFTHSLHLFRQARQSCTACLAEAEALGWRRIALVGASELSEIAALSAMDTSLEVVAVFDRGMRRQRFAGVPVVREAESLPEGIDGAIVTVLRDVPKWHAIAVAAFGEDRVLVPGFLRSAVRPRIPEDAA
jgi:DNA-binding MarR family transcriptional regulator